MNIKQFYTIIASVLALISLGIISSLRAVKLEDPTKSLDFRVRECLKTDYPGQCVRKRGLIVPGLTRIHRFVIYGGELNVNRRRESGLPNDEYRQLDEDFLQVVISSGARINTKDSLGLTALDYAQKNSNMFAILRRAGAKHSSEL
ncbi:MAG: hypothetical protein AB7F19_07290 [Candidatus Babeliales bacterium]